MENVTLRGREKVEERKRKRREKDGREGKMFQDSLLDSSGKSNIDRQQSCTRHSFLFGGIEIHSYQRCMIPVIEGYVCIMQPYQGQTPQIATNKNVNNFESRIKSKCESNDFFQKRNTSFVCCSYLNFVPNFLFRFRVFDT